ncbi:DUF928 domain-containing protein [cf. Phormidesmis sp. LEGE 11477]|uniref:DUF928 domain-containing protein n=1 Tax=cf. Phormidesmis sp. LEGE 11477 TaxID=1828680 RepID=UPI0018827C83|nr:DUF928 domain-containing protein [cf. Phormidesmis sp. LEGE 11477]MBE9064622.1 DUF928 domain-containing protein [cf. Phormidesmis sp. LEGE 11477]
MPAWIAIALSAQASPAQASSVQTLLAQRLLAQSSSPPSTIQFLPTPPDQGAPDGRQRGGANRGDCLPYQDLTALVPEIDGTVWSQTASENPSFFFNIPAALTESVPAELVIQDSNDNYAFRKEFAIETAAGILAVPVSELMPGQSYSWTFSIYCDAARPSNSVSVSGTIQRVADLAIVPIPAEEQSTEPLSTEQLSNSQKLNLLQQYAENGIWHEAIALAISIHQSEPSNTEYAEILESLLAQAGLSNFSLSTTIYEVP